MKNSTIRAFPGRATELPAGLTPPRGLSREARRFWRAVVEEYAVDDVAGIRVLTTACEAFDRMRAAQARIRRDGQMMRDRFGQWKRHPLIDVERDARAGMLAALKGLNLDLEPIRDRIGRPPGR